MLKSYKYGNHLFLMLFLIYIYAELVVDGDELLSDHGDHIICPVIEGKIQSKDVSS